VLCYLVEPAAQQCSVISARPAARTHLPTVPSPHTLSNSAVYGYRCSTTLNRLIRLPELLLPTKCCSVPTKWTLRELIVSLSYIKEISHTHTHTHTHTHIYIYTVYIYIYIYIYKVQAGRSKLILRGDKNLRRLYALMTWTGTILRYVSLIHCGPA